MKLKTYLTNLGFFELAIAAPSMKAALEAWGMSHNAFQHGFAKQTEDPAIVTATTAKPGVVLKRAVGTTRPFTEDASLPDALPNIRPPGRISKAAAYQRRKESPRKPTQKTTKSDPAAVISFEKARRKRERERAKEAAKLEKQNAERERATGKAQAALADAQEAHQKAMDAIAREQEKLDRRSENENARWETQRKKLTEAVDRARD